MKYLKIGNQGELDIRLVALMGGTTKTGKEGLIGQFGSGLKYTLAYLLRNNMDFHIFSGEEKCNITTVSEEIQGIDFDIICINGERTSITSNMGKEWLPWMIVRELYSNSLDEGESVHEVTTTFKGEPDKTNIYIQITKEIQEVINDWGKYFIHDKTPISTQGNYKIYSGGESLRLYKQGVLIYEDKDHPALFSYDVSYASINELREFTGSPNYYIVTALQNANKEVCKYYLENISNKVFEGKELDYDYSYGKWSDTWKETIGNARLIHQKAIEGHQARGMTIEVDQYIIVPEPVYKSLTKQFEGIGALKMAQKGVEFYEQYCNKTENRVNQALAILEACEYPLHKELDFRYGFFEDKRVNARINIQEKVVYISQGLLQKPLSEIVGILIEENEHYNTGFDDNTREFQQHFINLYTKELLAKNEIEV